MKRLTLSVEGFSGLYRRITNFGGRPHWCTFDYVVRRAPDVEGIEVVPGAEPDTALAEWFPHIRRGMERAGEATRARGEFITGVRVEVTKVHTHPVDTTATGCESYGFTFVIDRLRPHCVPISDSV